MLNNLNDITILVNSCDKYSDIWPIFFGLLKKYWSGINYKIILNTETKNYTFDGLDIECVHPIDPNVPYGKRMLNALEHIDTTFLIPLMDDFFIRCPINNDVLEQEIRYMLKEKSVACIYSVKVSDIKYDKLVGYNKKIMAIICA